MLNNFNSVEFQRKQRRTLSKKIEGMDSEKIIAFFNKRSSKEIQKRDKKINKTRNMSASK